MSDERCPQTVDHLEELALGVLGGRERSDVLAHLERCPACAEREQTLSMLGDALVDLVPASEPPVGFENRVLARLPSQPTRPGGRATPLSVTAAAGTRRPSRPRARRRVGAPVVALMAACAAIFGIGGFALGGATGTRAPTTNTAPARQKLLVAALHVRGRSVGRVYVDTGPRPWAYVEVYGLDARTVSVRCLLRYRDGRVESLGTYPVLAGAAEWGAPVHGDPAGLGGVSMTGPAGATVATATFGT